MKLFDSLFGNKNTEKNSHNIFECEPKALYSPLRGTSILLSQVEDPVFSEEIMGVGVGIIPYEGKLYAPLDGEVLSVFPTGHAVGLKSKDGMEILLHVGIDTVQMEGDGFKTHIKQGDHVKVGDLLIEFDCAKIISAGYQTTTMIVIPNWDTMGKMSEPILGDVDVRDKIFYFE